MTVRQYLSALLCLLLTAPAPVSAQAPAAATRKLSLTIDEIMRGPALYGNSPRAVRWSGDGSKIYFSWKEASAPPDKPFDTYVINRDGSGMRKLTDVEERLAPPLNGVESRDGKLILYTDRGDLYLYDRGTDTRRQLTKTTDVEANPRFTQDEKAVSFVRAGNLYTLSLDGGLLEQWTDIRSGAAGAAPAAPAAAFGGGRGQGQQGQRGGGGAQASTAQRGTESQEALKREERALLEIIEQRARRREEQEAERKKEETRKPFNLTARQSAGNLLLSPDRKYVLASIFEQPDGVKNTIVPNYVTESAYTENLNARSKVGDAQGRSRMAVVKTETGDVTWIDHGMREKAPAPPRSPVNSPASSEGPPPAAPPREREIERAIALSNPQWSDDGAKLAVMGRSADNKDRYIFAVDPATGKTRTLMSLHDDAWVGGPGSFTLGWLGDNKTIYFQSEKDGYSHLYTADFESGETRQLTSGKWEVESVQLSRDKKNFWLVTSEEGPDVRHFYSLPVTGGPRTKITTQPGNHDVVLSPDERFIAVIYSYTNKPPELYVMDNKPGAVLKKLTDSPAPEFWTYNWQDVPIVKIPARDGAQVPARFYKPKNFRAGGPAVIFVHGAGYTQNVHRWWSSYAREYMFHHFLMERGYVVLDLDYRASAGYGRDWRTAIYRHMGGKDLDDQVDAARWVVKEHGVDAKRIGIYGGSYGGFITLMALFTQPDVFAAGAALRPVTDWAHYNHGYTSNILNVPQQDLEAYKRSSPIYHAAGLKGALLICHGMVDVNVHYQDSVRLVQKLIELRKENWEFASYPVEDHGFVQPTSWADEYKRIFKLFETNLKKSS